MAFSSEVEGGGEEVIYSVLLRADDDGKIEECSRIRRSLSREDVSSRPYSACEICYGGRGRKEMEDGIEGGGRGEGWRSVTRERGKTGGRREGEREGGFAARGRVTLYTECE